MLDSSSIRIDRETAINLLAQWHEACCGEHGSNDQEHDVAAEIFELLWDALGMPPNEHKDH